LWHRRLGHIRKRYIKIVHLDGILEIINFWIIWQLQILSKSRDDHKTPFVGQFRRATKLLDVIHNDVYSPLYVVACGGFFDFLNFQRWFE
jgi:hypothetical protein